MLYKIKQFFINLRLKFLADVFPNGHFSGRGFLKWCGYGLIAFLIFIILLIAWYSIDLPTPGKLARWRSAESTHIYDRQGNLLYDISGEKKRTMIDFKDMPDNIKQATIAIEDQDFYKHHGIRLQSIGRAILADIFNRRAAQGGSTITQQFVKNAILSPKKTLARKLKELILTLEVEAIYPKDKILEMYLNEIPYGANLYGIQAAAKGYFNKDAKDLTLAEATTLAAIPQAPTYYSPYGSHPDKRIARANYVLDQMVKEKFITSEQAQAAKTEIPKIKFAKKRETITAPHFVMYIKELLVDKYGEKMVEEGGLKVTTTLDPDWQKAAEDAVYGSDATLNRYGASNAGLVSLDPKTGQVMAMVGSLDFFDTEHDGQVNIATSERQPGSSFKPVAYATAFKGKYNPAFTLYDVKTDFGGYSPDDYDGKTRGPVSMRAALANSLNIPAVKTLSLAGIDNTIATAHQMGITTLNKPASYYGLALVLGGGEVKLLDMATAYGTFANQGVQMPTTPFLEVKDNRNKVLEKYQTPKKKNQAIDKQIAYEISSILSDNAARTPIFGSNSPLYFGGRKVAAKTGTSQEARDAWTLGYTPSVAAGVWTGNFDNTPMTERADGVNVAGPIFHKFMASVLENQKNEDFSRPDGIKDVEVDKLSNKLPTDNSPETIKEIFASWQVPTEQDNIHVKVKVCKENGLLATDQTPSEYIEEKVFTDIHSERPDLPNWEGPVLAWARANDILASPPTEKCLIYNPENKPKVTITTPSNGANVSGNFTITVSISASNGMGEVEFYIDNNSIAKDTSSPYSTSYNAGSLGAGNHTIKVIVRDKYGFSNEATITVKTTADTSAPGSVTGVTATAGAGQVILKWTNPTDADISKARIYMSTSSGNLGSLKKEITVYPSTGNMETITGLTVGTKYYFTVRCVDGAGNENSSTTQYSATPT